MKKLKICALALLLIIVTFSLFLVACGDGEGDETDGYYIVNVIGGRLSIGTTKGSYAPGDTVTVVADETDSNGKSFLYWKNSADKPLSPNATASFTAGASDETYTAVYGVAPKLSLWSFNLLDDGTYGVKIAGQPSYDQTVLSVPAFYENTPVTVIEDLACAHEYCGMINEIFIPETVTKIGIQAFFDFRGLKRLVIPGSVKSIGDGAFLACSYLEELTLEEGIEYIGVRAFSDNSLASVKIPASVERIGSGAFSPSSSECEVAVDENNAKYFSSNGYLIEKETGRLIFGRTDGKIPDEVKIIGESVYANEKRLKNVTLHSNIVAIERAAFWDSGIESITIPEGVESIGDIAFAHCELLKSIIVAEGNTAYRVEGNCLIENATASLLVGAKNCVVPDGMKRIAAYALAERDFAALILPESLEKLERDWLGDCDYQRIFYAGSREKLDTIDFSGHPYLFCCYLETEPEDDGYYWHYVDGNPTPWK